jgi:hypothetical protein
MGDRKPLDINQARRIVGTDRLLLIGLISLLIDKGTIGGDDLKSLASHIDSAAEPLLRSGDPILQVQTDEARREALHVLAAFKV